MDFPNRDFLGVAFTVLHGPWAAVKKTGSAQESDGTVIFTLLSRRLRILSEWQPVAGPSAADSAGSCIFAKRLTFCSK